MIEGERDPIHEANLETGDSAGHPPSQVTPHEAGPEAGPSPRTTRGRQPSIKDLDSLAHTLRISSRMRALAEGISSAEPGTPRWKIGVAAGFTGPKPSIEAHVSRALRNGKFCRYMRALAATADAHLIRRTQAAILSRAGLLRRLSAQADADMGRYVDLDEEGHVQALRIPRGATRAIRAVKLRTRTRPGRDGEADVVEREVELRVADPVPAARLLAEMRGWAGGGGEVEDGARDAVRALAVRRPDLFREVVLALLAPPPPAGVVVDVVAQEPDVRR